MSAEEATPSSESKNRKRRIAWLKAEEAIGNSSSIRPMPSLPLPKVDEEDLDTLDDFEVQDSDEDEKLSFTTESCNWIVIRERYA